MRRPDLSNIPLDVRIYIQYLEEQIRQSSPKPIEEDIQPDTQKTVDEKMLQPELPSDANLITLTNNGLVKKTPRYLYTRQHRGGFGINDINIESLDYPVSLSTCSDPHYLLVFTNLAKVYRVNTSLLPQTQLKENGIYISEKIMLEAGETFIAALPTQSKGYISLLSRSGKVRCLRHHLFGEHMKQGTAMYNPSEFGPLSSVAWTPGDADLFIVSKHGMGIRFNEKSVSPQGDIGIRLTQDDVAVAVTAVYPDSLVFIAGSDGKGTLRNMRGFAPNKSPGGSGKIAIKNHDVVGAKAVEIDDELFLATRTGKIIRFYVNEIPETEGVVQGVNCIMMRADHVTGLMRLTPSYGI